MGQVLVTYRVCNARVPSVWVNQAAVRHALVVDVLEVVSFTVDPISKK